MSELTDIARHALARCEVRTLRLARNAITHCRTVDEARGVLLALFEDAAATRPSPTDPGGSPETLELEATPC